MRVCVDGTANLRCTISEWFAYHLPQTEICRVFAGNTKITGCVGCPFHALGVLCSPQVCAKLINRAPLMYWTQTAQRVSDALVYTNLKVVTYNVYVHVAYVTKHSDIFIAELHLDYPLVRVTASNNLLLPRSKDSIT